MLMCAARPRGSRTTRRTAGTISRICSLTRCCSSGCTTAPMTAAPGCRSTPPSITRGLPARHREKASRCAPWYSFRRLTDSVFLTGRLAPSTLGARRRTAKTSLHSCGRRPAPLSVTPADGSGLWPARAQAPAGAYRWDRSRPSPTEQVPGERLREDKWRADSAGWAPPGTLPPSLQGVEPHRAAGHHLVLHLGG